MNLKSLLSKEIVWNKHPNHERYFYHISSEGIFALRINNGPGEPLLTIISGLNILDIDDMPRSWAIE